MPSLDDVHIDDLLKEVVRRNASDLHLCVGVPPILRIDGQLYRTNFQPATPKQTQRLIYEILTDEQIQRFESSLELDFSYALQDIARFRVNVYKERGCIAAAFRLIPRRIPTVRELELPPILEELATRPRGLILVTGPTGHGKSTTLAAMIDYINRTKSVHIITIEDPIEYLHTHKKSVINQRELGEDTRSFPNALRAALRQDPDVILVGEMRDPETMAIAITAAETGHLVLSTVHTNSAAETIDRIIDVFPPNQQPQIRVQLSMNLVAVISQQLLPRAPGAPRNPYGGGRIAAVEIMIANPAIRNLIREGKTYQIPSIIQTSAAEGMQTMDQALRDLYVKGLITYETAMERAHNPEELKKLIAGAVGASTGTR
ncbi:type IV pilus twitching motility protein PilT [Candidatus Fervidibacter sacchari]|uniref:type IV pilus twitching motility protein PilT n=1 Tax=Candidatus Fervidibacter sacchari TaxID=1448929 RepID=UPI0038991C1E